MEREGIACIGLAVWDTIKTIRAYPAEGRYVEVEHSAGRVGGNVSNVLIDIAMIDPTIPLFAVSAVGCDPEGDAIVSTLRGFGIDVSRVHRNTELITSRSDIVTSRDSGSRTIFYQTGASHSIGLQLIESLSLSVKIVQIAYLGALPGLDAEDVPGGTGDHEPSSDFARALAHFQKQGCKTTIDTASVQVDAKMRAIFHSCLPFTDYLIMNEVEAGTFFSETIRDADGRIVDDVVRSVVNTGIQSGVGEAVVIHCPEKAAYLDRGGNYRDVPAGPLAVDQIESSVGAGDAFAAGFLYAVHQEYDPETALRLGHASARLNLQSPESAHSASLRELREIMR